MGLRGRLAGVAVTRVSLLVVEVPGWAPTRWAVEREMRRRGWRLAASPADADVLVTCGTPGPRLAQALELTWAQLPGPRSRADVLAPSAAGAVLDQTAAELLDEARQRADAADRPPALELGSPAAEDNGADEDNDGGDGDGEDGDGSMDMDMDMDMEMPGGIPLASGGGEDRDGLDLDALHLPLGPVLPCWSPGLLLHCTLHGDVVAQARAEVLGAAPTVAPPDWPDGWAPADRLDRLAQLLTVAGWDEAGTAAARIRDDLLDGGDPASCAPRLDRLSRRIRRSRLLRWSLRGLGTIDAEIQQRHGVDPRWCGDAHDRLLETVSQARAALDGDPLPAPAPVDVLPRLVTGLELTALRLVVASVAVDTGRPARGRPVTAGGAA